MSLDNAPSYRPTRPLASAKPLPAKLAFNADLAAIAIALIFAALVRLDIIHRITW